MTGGELARRAHPDRHLGCRLTFTRHLSDAHHTYCVQKLGVPLTRACQCSPRSRRAHSPPHPSRTFTRPFTRRIADTGLKSIHFVSEKLVNWAQFTLKDGPG